MSWIISVPVWGDYHTEIFTKLALPAIKAAVQHANIDATFVIHADDPGSLFDYVEDLPKCYICSFPCQAEWKYEKSSMGHVAAMRLAGRCKPGTKVGLFNADVIPSMDLFSNAEKQFALGKKCYLVDGVRVTGSPPIGALSPVLYSWAMRHLHPVLQECFWGGWTSEPGALYFHKDDTVILRIMLLHPICIVMDRNLDFVNSLDTDLIKNYSREEIYMATTVNEGVCASITPPDLRFPGPRMTVDSVAAYARERINHGHNWIFSQRIRISGDGDPGDREICDQIIAKWRA